MNQKIKQTPVIHTEQSIDYFPGEIDYAAVEDFLSLLNPAVEVARVSQLAASLALKAENYSAVDLVRNAVEIQAESEKSVLLRRDWVLAGMNFGTVERLVERLRNLDSISSESEEGVVSEQGPYRSILSTVLERYRELERGPLPGVSPEAVKVALAEAKVRTKIPIPESPCDLATALRFVSGVQTTPHAALEMAFNDFLAIFRLRRAEKAGSEDDAGGETPWNSQQREAQSVQEQVFLQNFAPGLKPPVHIARETRDLVESRWRRSDSVSSESLAWLAIDFYPFWKKHKQAYLEQHASAKLASEKKAEVKRKSGGKGVEAREQKRLVGLVKDWLQYADSHEKPPNEIIEIFVSETKGTTELTRRKYNGFLMRLHDYVANERDVDHVVATLRKEGMKSITSEMLQGCATVLKEHRK
ncbi:MAG: hypothetical protein ABI600_15065 [Luteolibacter sp.]